MTEQDWQKLVSSVRDADCLVFLGAGASTVLEGQVGLPTGGQLSKKLAEQCEYPGVDKSDFLRAANTTSSCKTATACARRYERN